MLTTVTVMMNEDKPLAEVKVESATLCGKLALHPTIDAKGWTITHVPTGFAVRNQMRRRKDAETLMLQLAELWDWNFSKPYGRKWRSKMGSLWPIVREVERY
jgi:hypothetical protein